MQLVEVGKSSEGRPQLMAIISSEANLAKLTRYNRDWFVFKQIETRNVGRQLYHEWFPQIVYNQHQTGAFPRGSRFARTKIRPIQTSHH